jgi:3-hydroxyisobutyrate dehydrogenase-like beta-hydroxyacid dehydrogenase
MSQKVGFIGLGNIGQPRCPDYGGERVPKRP